MNFLRAGETIALRITVRMFCFFRLYFVIFKIYIDKKSYSQSIVLECEFKALQISFLLCA